MIVLGMLGYVLLQFVIGVWVSRRISSEADYILAGRTLGPLLVAFSVFATWFGAEAIVATSGEVYDRGLVGATVDPVAYAGAVVISGLVFASVLWRKGLTTFADMFRERYSRRVETVVVVVLLPGSIFWAAAQIRAFGGVLSSSSGINLTTTIVFAAILVAAYSVVGGLLADAVTDFLQGLVVIVGLIVLAIIVAANTGGIAPVLSNAEPERLNLFAATDESPLRKIEQIVIAICGSLVAVELISRFLGARSASVARTGTVAGGLMYLAVGLIPVFLGLAAAHLFKVNPEFKATFSQSEQVVSALAQHFLPQWNYVVFAGALISAILSTVHSALHAPASQVSHNIVAKLLPRLDAKGRLLAVRLTVVALSIVAFVLALTSERIKDLVEIASAFGSAGVFVAAVFGIFTSIGGPASGLGSIVVGVAVWAAGRFALNWKAPYIAALLCSTIAYLAIAVSQTYMQRARARQSRAATPIQTPVNYRPTSRP
jgi:SSS family transporter